MATSTRSLTVPTKEAANERRCPCGCAPCEGTCCHLDCIVRPRFFCGQLLTDADLSALLKWARDRFALSRYRHGWGVVCGLDVRCDPKRPAAIVITPGYAVNCCGDDIVVCEDAALDLSDACREEADPCADLRRRYEAAVVPGAILRSDAEGERLAGGGFMGSPGVAEKARLRIVDIYLRYDEKPSEPTTALGRGSCKQVSECEYSRTRESYKLTWEFGVQGSDPVQAHAERWHEGYEKCLDVLKEFRGQFTNGFPAADVRRWLVRWIDAHPQSRLCDKREAICSAPESYLSNEGNLVRLLFELVLECRTTYLNCDCFGCEKDTGVPLARVWLTTDEGGGREGCRIRAIDPFPPYRRPIKPECWPAPLGSVNVGRFIWHRWDEACTALDDLGVHATKKEFTLPATLLDLQKALQCDLFVKCDERRDALVYNTDLFGERIERVVGFCKAADIPPPPLPNMTLTKTGRPTEARPGQPVTYLFEVTNTGNVPLQVRVEDASLTLDRNLGTIEPGRSQSFEHPGAIPASASGIFSNTARATGTGGGQTIARSDTADITILVPGCPHIVVQCPDIAVVGETITFRSLIKGGDPKVTPTFKWTVAAGTISSGQGTSQITVDTIGQVAGSSVTATVEVGGYDPSCDTTKSCTTPLRTLTPNCPTIEVIGQDTARVGEAIGFRGIIKGGDPNVTPTFNWTMAAGTIQSGQGTSQIVVDTTGLPINSSVTAMLEVGGFDPSCKTIASDTTRIVGQDVPSTRKFDQYGDLTREGQEGESAFADENARLDNFAFQLQSEPGAQGHIIVYGTRLGRPEEVRERAARAKDYLVNVRGIDASRIAAVDGGLRNEFTFELWIVPAGATPPTPTPTEQRDDLTAIAQIGPARATKLNEAGMRTFAELASASVERLKALFPELAEEVLTKWIKDAKSLAG